MARYLLVHISYEFDQGRPGRQPECWKYEYWLINQKNPLGPLEKMPGYIFTKKRHPDDPEDTAVTLQDAQRLVEGKILEQSTYRDIVIKDIRPK